MLKITLQEKKECTGHDSYVRNGKSFLTSRVDNQATDSSSSYYSDTDKSNVRRSTLNKSRLDALDKLSVRIGTTLRRYPSARIFILLYMVCIFQ